MTSSLNNIVPSFQETIHFPSSVSPILTGFSEVFSQAIEGVSELTTYQAFMDIHRELMNITNFTNRYARKIVAVADAYPPLDIVDTISRYNGLILLYKKIDLINGLIRRLQICIQGGFLTNIVQDDVHTLRLNITDQETKLAMAASMLMGSIRTIEYKILQNNPNFDCYPRQPFEI